MSIRKKHLPLPAINSEYLITNSRSDSQRTFLMIKEYNFLTKITEEIAKKATKIYDKQITKNKVLKYHCDYRKLEKAFDGYKQK